MTTHFLLVRHAESTWNAEGRWQGHGDPPLSERGRQQAAALAQRLRGEAVDRLVASDLRRALQTAEALGEVLGHSPQADPGFRELDVGRWTGLERDEIEAREGEALAAFERGDPDCRPGGGETRREIRRRVRTAARSLAAAHPGARIALVTHLGVIRALLPGQEPENAALLRASADQFPEPDAESPLSTPPLSAPR